MAIFPSRPKNHSPTTSTPAPATKLIAACAYEVRAGDPFFINHRAANATPSATATNDSARRRRCLSSADFPPLPESGGETITLSRESLASSIALVARERKCSTSFIQRYLQIGYNRAARIVERMEREGVVSAANHVGKREVLARDIDDRER